MALKTISLLLLLGTLNAEVVDSNEAVNTMSKFVQLPATRMMTRPANPVVNGATFATASDALLEETVADLEKQSQELQAEYQFLRARMEKLSHDDVNASISAPSSSSWYAALIASLGLAATMGVAAVKKYMGQGRQATAFQIPLAAQAPQRAGPIVAMAQTGDKVGEMTMQRAAAKAAAGAALGASLVLSSTPAFAEDAPAGPPTVALDKQVGTRKKPLKYKLVQVAQPAPPPDNLGPLKYSYTNMPWEDLDNSTAKFSPKAGWNTLYPEKKLVLEKKSPVSRRDLAPAGNFATYAQTYPGLYSAISGQPMGSVPPLMKEPAGTVAE